MNLIGQFKMIFVSHSETVSRYYSEIAIVFTTIMTIVSYLVGGWDKAIKALLILVVIDIITGSLVGFFVKKNFSSKRLREGFGTKVMYILVIAVGNLLDDVFFADTPILRTMAVYFYVWVEGFSILENLGNLGVPLPRRFIDKMAQIEEQVGGFAKMKDGKFLKSDDEDDVNC